MSNKKELAVAALQNGTVIDMLSTYKYKGKRHENDKHIRCGGP